MERADLRRLLDSAARARLRGEGAALPVGTGPRPCARRFGAPAREAVARAAGIEPGVTVLDVGCGSGEFCELATAR